MSFGEVATNVYTFPPQSAPSLLVPVVADMKALTVEAEKNTVADGTEKAKRLAGLVGASIGDIISITATTEAAVVPNVTVPVPFYSVAGKSSGSLDEVKVQRRFTMVFELK